MYPLLCVGGYPVPQKEGQMDIVAVSVSPVAVGAAMKVTLRDDNRDISADASVDVNKNEVVHMESAGANSLFQAFDPPLRMRRGVMASYLTNAVCQVYVR